MAKKIVKINPMRYLILFLLISSPAMAMEQWLIDARNEADAYYNYGMTVNPRPIDGGYNAPKTRYDEPQANPAPPTIADQPITPVWQPQPYQEDDNLHDWQYLQPADQPQAQYRTPAERLSDCAYNHDCQGEFAP